MEYKLEIILLLFTDLFLRDTKTWQRYIIEMLYKSYTCFIDFNFLSIVNHKTIKYSHNAERFLLPHSL